MNAFVNGQTGGSSGGVITGSVQLPNVNSGMVDVNLGGRPKYVIASTEQGCPIIPYGLGTIQTSTPPTNAGSETFYFRYANSYVVMVICTDSGFSIGWNAAQQNNVIAYYVAFM